MAQKIIKLDGHLNQKISTKLIERMSKARELAFNITQSEFVRQAIKKYCDYIETKFKG